MLDPEKTARLADALAEGRRIGAIGPSPFSGQVAQALGYLAAGLVPEGATVADLGSGGGLPALPLALARPDLRWVLIEAWTRRAEALTRAVRRLALDDRIEVRAQRAEDVGRGPWRGAVDVVLARAFGPTAVTLECAAPLVRDGGIVCCSVREDEAPWPGPALDALGLHSPVRWRVGGFTYQAVRRAGPLDQRFPRRPGVPERRPLF